MVDVFPNQDSSWGGAYSFVRDKPRQETLSMYKYVEPRHVPAVGSVRSCVTGTLNPHTLSPDIS